MNNAGMIKKKLFISQKKKKFKSACLDQNYLMGDKCPQLGGKKHPTTSKVF